MPHFSSAIRNSGIILALLVSILLSFPSFSSFSSSNSSNLFSKSSSSSLVLFVSSGRIIEENRMIRGGRRIHADHVNVKINLIKNLIQRKTITSLTQTFPTLYMSFLQASSSSSSSPFSSFVYESQKRRGSFVSLPFYSVATCRKSAVNTNTNIDIKAAMSTLSSLSPRKRKQMLKKRDRDLNSNPNQKKKTKAKAKTTKNNRQQAPSTKAKVNFSPNDNDGKGSKSNNSKNIANTSNTSSSLSSPSSCSSSLSPPAPIILDENEFQNKDYYPSVVKAYKRQNASKKILELYQIAAEHNCLTAKLMKLSLRVQRDLNRIEFVESILDSTVNYILPKEGEEVELQSNDIMELKVEVVREYVRNDYFTKAKHCIQSWFGLNLNTDISNEDNLLLKMTPDGSSLRKNSLTLGENENDNRPFPEVELDIIDKDKVNQLLSYQSNIISDLVILFSTSYLKKSKTLPAWYYFSLLPAVYDIQEDFFNLNDKTDTPQKNTNIDSDTSNNNNYSKNNYSNNMGSPFLSSSPPPLEYINSLLKQLGESKDLSRILVCFDTFPYLGINPDATAYTHLSNTAITNVDFVTGAVSMDTLPSSSTYGRKRKLIVEEKGSGTKKEGGEGENENGNEEESFDDFCILPNQFKEAIFIGRSNVGKSSLINMIMNRKDLAYVSKKPGKTRQFNYFLVNDVRNNNNKSSRKGTYNYKKSKRSNYQIEKRNPFYLVDLPGFGYAKTSRDLREAWATFQQQYLSTNTNLKVVFHLIDSRHGPLDADLQMMENIQNDLLHDAKYVCILTKTDKKEGGKSQVRPAVLTSLDKALKECGFQGAKFPSSSGIFSLDTNTEKEKKERNENEKTPSKRNEKVPVLFTSSETRLGLDHVWKELSILF